MTNIILKELKKRMIPNTFLMDEMNPENKGQETVDTIVDILASRNYTIAQVRCLFNNILRRLEMNMPISNGEV